MQSNQRRHNMNKTFKDPNTKYSDQYTPLAMMADAPEIPTPTVADAGKVLTVGETGAYELGEGGSSDIPTPTVADAGKVLTVGETGAYELGDVDAPSGGGEPVAYIQLLFGSNFMMTGYNISDYNGNPLTSAQLLQALGSNYGDVSSLISISGTDIVKAYYDQYDQYVAITAFSFNAEQNALTMDKFNMELTGIAEYDSWIHKRSISTATVTVTQSNSSSDT